MVPLPWLSLNSGVSYFPFLALSFPLFEMGMAITGLPLFWGCSDDTPSVRFLTRSPAKEWDLGSPESLSLGQPWLLSLGRPQVLLNVLTLNRNLSDSLAHGRLHPDLQSNLLQVDSECTAEIPRGWARSWVEKGSPPKGSLTYTSITPCQWKFGFFQWTPLEQWKIWGLEPVLSFPGCAALGNACLHSEPQFSHL